MPNPEAFISTGGELAELAASEAREVSERLLGSATPPVKVANDMLDPIGANAADVVLDAVITPDGKFGSVIAFQGLTAREAAMSDHELLWERVDRILHFSRSTGLDEEYSPAFQKLMTAAARKGSAIDNV